MQSHSDRIVLIILLLYITRAKLNMYQLRMNYSKYKELEKMFDAFN